jgi:lysophospholipase L1-like esterase
LHFKLTPTGTDVKRLLLLIFILVAACNGAAEQQVPPTKPISDTVAFMGDSITSLWDVQDYDTTNPTLNFGVSGQLTAQMLARFSEVLTSGAGIVVIDGGINDLYVLGPENTNTDSIREMAAEASAAGMRVILCALIPDSYDYPTGAAPQLADILAFNDKLLYLAQQNGYLYADYYPAMLLPNGEQDVALTKDGLHPNAAGYARMWSVLQPLIEEDLQ